MLLSYLKTAVRNLLRYRLFSVVSVLGLALGLAGSLLIFSYVWHESTYEGFNANREQVFRVEGGYTGWFIGEQASRLPVVERAGRQWGSILPLIRSETLRAHQQVTGIDADLVQMLDLPFLIGDQATALAEAHSVIISDRMARLYFPEGEPIGKTLRWDDLLDLRVTGVFRLPTNSFFRHEIVFSCETLQVDPQFKGRSFGYLTFVQLRQGVTPDAFRQSLRAGLLADGHQNVIENWDERGFQVSLERIDRIHEPPYIRHLAGIGLFVLLIACVNFINLSTARSTQRVREVGMRRVVGARRDQLAGQFLLESGLQAAVAAVLAVGLVLLTRSWFRSVSGVDPFEVASADRGILWLLCGLIVVTFLGAAYPAFVLARLHPAGVFKDAKGTGSGATLRRRLVEFQFALAIVLVAGTAAVVGQLTMMRETDVGFDRSHVIVFKTGYKGVYDRTGDVAADMKAVPGVLGVGRHQSMPFSTRQFGGDLRLEGEQEPLQPLFWMVDEGFIDAMRLRLIAGRSARAGLHWDQPELVLNASALAALGFDDPREAIGKTAHVIQGPGTIVGVVDDFHLMSLHQRTGPVVLQTPRRDSDYQTENYAHIAVRLESASLPDVLDRLQAVWERYAPGWPLNHHFIDDDFDQQYRNETRLANVLTAFASMALAVMGLGVFALAAFSAQQRTKEIGIRKVVGATAQHILLLLTIDFGRLFLVAAAIALPLSYWGVEQWLDSFAFRIEPGAGLLARAALVVLLVAAVAISQQAWKAMGTQPVEALRHE